MSLVIHALLVTCALQLVKLPRSVPVEPTQMQDRPHQFAHSAQLEVSALQWLVFLQVVVVLDITRLHVVGMTKSPTDVCHVLLASTALTLHRSLFLVLLDGTLMGMVPTFVPYALSITPVLSLMLLLTNALSLLTLRDKLPRLDVNIVFQK